MVFEKIVTLLSGQPVTLKTLSKYATKDKFDKEKLSQISLQELLCFEN